MRTLDTGNRVVPNNLVEHVHALGYRYIMRGDTVICDDSDDTYAAAAKYAIQAGNVRGKAVAWIGGGFCIGPRVFALMGATQAIFEAEAPLAEFVPAGATFVPGDWTVTLVGRYDVIVYDLGGDAPISQLTAHLNAGGIILPPLPATPVLVR